MPPTGQPYGRTALPTKTVESAEYVSLSERMAQDYFKLGASHRADQDAESLAQIQLPQPSITGTTGYESMLGEESGAEESAYGIHDVDAVDGGAAQRSGGGGTSLLTPDSSLLTPRPDSFGRSPMMPMPEAPSLPRITPRRMAPEQAQSFELPGTATQSAPDQAITFPAAGASGAAATAYPGGAATSGGGGAEAPRPGDIEAYIRHAAASRGIDPDIAVRVARSEGGLDDPVRQSDVVYQGQREQSYGPLQLNVNGGVGSAALKAGIDPRNPAQWRQALDFGLDEVARAGWGQWHGAARVGIGEREGIGTYRGPPPPAPPAVTQRAAEGRAAAGELQGSTPPQFGLGDADADAICGPVLAMAFAKAEGRNPTIDEAKQMAATHGRWTSAQGMGGPEAMANTLRQMGIPAHYAPGGLDVETIRRETQNGNPVGINTRGHYFVVEGVDADGRLDLGNSAKALRASGGRQWFRAQEIEGLGMGAPTGAIYKDSPSSPTPSVAVRETNLPPVAHAQTKEAMAPEQRMEHDALSLAALSDPSVGAEDLRVAHVGGGAVSDSALGMPETAPAGPPARDDYRMETTQPYDPDQGPREQPYPGTVSPIQNPNGSVTTERTITVTEPDLNNGQPTNIPTVWSGQVVDDETAITNAINSGRRYVAYPSIDEAVTAAEQRSSALVAGATSIGGAVPFAAPYDPDQGPREALPGSVGATPYLGPLSTQPELVTPPPQPVAAPQPSFAPEDYSSQTIAPSPPTDASRTSWQPTDAEQAAFGQPVGPEWLPEPVRQGLGAISAGSDYLDARANPTAPMLVRSGILVTDLTPEQQERHNELQRRTSPVSRRPGETQLSAAEMAEYRSIQDALEARYQAIKDDPDQYMQYYHAAPGSNVLPAFLGVAAAPAVGGVVGAGARGAAGALGAGARTARAIGYGADIAAQTAFDPTTPFTQGPIDAVTAAVRAGRRVPGQVGAAIAENAQRTAEASARMAAEGSTAAPGVFGLSGLTPDEPLVRGMRPRIIPPDVADTLDFPIRLPEDPSVIRAIEAAGGTVDERGTTLNVIRNQGPEAAGGTATRSMTYHIAGPPGTPNPFTGGDIGGSVRFEGPTRFRNPLFITQESGGKGYLDDALEQLGVMSPGDAEQIARTRRWLDSARARLEIVQMAGRADEAAQQAGVVRGLERDLADLESPRPVAGRREIDEQVNAIRRSTDQGSPERVAALQELVQRYGGDPSVIPDLVARRVGETESGYAIVENIIAANARAKQHDGVIYLGQGSVDFAAVNAHPRVVAANRALEEANAAEREARQRYDLWKSRMHLHGQGPRDAADEGWARLQGLARDEGRRTPVEAEWVTENDMGRAQQRARDAVDDLRRTERDVHNELRPRTIEELADTREARNPTPGAPHASVADAEAAKDAAQSRYERLNADLASRLRARPDARAELLEEADQAYRAWEAAQERVEALRRGDTSGIDAELAALSDGWLATINRVGDFRPDDTLETWLARQAPEIQAESARVQRVADNLRAAQAGIGAGPSGYTLRPDIPRRGPGSEIAQGTVGSAPALAAGARGPDAFALATRVLAEPIAGGVGGATIGAGLPAETEEERRRNTLIGAGAGMVGFPAATRLARGAARAAGAGGDVGGGALATAGGLPGPGPRPNTGVPGGAGPPPGMGALETGRRMAGEVGYASMIGPTSFTTSMLGGPVELAWNLPKQALEAALPKALGGRGAPHEVITIGAGTLRGLGQVGMGLIQGLKGQGIFADVMRGQGRYAPVPGREPLSQLATNPAVKTAAGAVEATTRFFTGVPDALYGTIGRSIGEYLEAAQIATAHGYTGARHRTFVDTLLTEADRVKANPRARSLSPDAQKVVTAGEQYGKRVTYQDDLGTWGDAVKKWATVSVMPDGAGGTKPLPVVGSMVSPFFNTPWNANLRLGEKVPGIGASMNTQAGLAKTYDQVLGTALVAGMAAHTFANAGITGSGPEDGDERKMLEATGWRPYHTKFYGYYIPNRNLQPFGPLLNAVGDVHDALKYNKEQTPASLGMDFVSRFGSNVKDQVWLQGIADLIEGMESGSQAGGKAGAERYAAGLVTRMIPWAATARAIGTSQDPYARDTERGKDVPVTRAVGQQVQRSVGLGQGIPGLVDPLPIRQDVLGRPVANPQQGLGAFFAPTTSERPEPLIGAYRAAGVSIGRPPTVVSDVTLTDAQQRRWNAARGQALLAASGDVAATRTLPPSERKAELQRILREAGVSATAAIEPTFSPRQRMDAERKKGA